MWLDVTILQSLDGKNLYKKIGNNLVYKYERIFYIDVFCIVSCIFNFALHSLGLTEMSINLMNNIPKENLFFLLLYCITDNEKVTKQPVSKVIQLLAERILKCYQCYNNDPQRITTYATGMNLQITAPFKLSTGAGQIIRQGDSG